MKKLIIALTAALLVCYALPVMAETPPVSTVTVAGPELVSFRVWVFPGIVDGVQVSGHYEYFDMYMDTGHQREVLEPMKLEPALKALPVTHGTAPAQQ